MKYSELALKLEPSITLEITAKAKKMREEGIDVISFGAGEPDFNTPQNIINAAASSMEKGLTKYTPASGIIQLKEAIVKKLKMDNGLDYNVSQIIVSTGAKQCLSNFFQAVLNPGDEVIIPNPCWVSYPELVRLYGGNPVFVETDESNNFKPTVESLKKAITSKTKVVVITSPNNPTGAVYGYEELEQIAKLAIENDFLILSDEIYEKLIYDSTKHISIASVSKEAFDRTIVVNGVSKTYAMTGWRIGYAAGPADIIKIMSNVQSHTTSNASSISQYAALEALDGPQEDINKMIEQFKIRRDYMVEKINEINDIYCIKPEGAFYVMINISKLKDKKHNGVEIKDSITLSKLMLENAHIAVVPGIAFGNDDYIRLSYATSLTNIENGLKRLETFVDSINN